MVKRKWQPSYNKKKEIVKKLMQERKKEMIVR